MKAARLLLVAALCAFPAGADQRRSGFDYMSAETQAMQRDDASNPGMLSVLEGETLWNAPAGTSGKACAGCHGAAKDSMAGVAARYPAFDAGTDRPIDLANKINQCRTERQTSTPLASESPELVALMTYVGHQSRGMPISPPYDPRMTAVRERGQALYEGRMGQLNFSCAQCHDARAGQKLGAATIPPALPTGYPLYRLEWQATGSLQRRFRNCMTGVRAEPFAFGASEFIALESYLMTRAAGMAVETPAVRP